MFGPLLWLHVRVDKAESAEEREARLGDECTSKRESSIQDKFEEEIKIRKKEEKQRTKVESKVEKLGVNLAATSVSSPRPPPVAERKQQKGHGK